MRCEDTWKSVSTINFSKYELPYTNLKEPRPDLLKLLNKGNKEEFAALR